MAKNYAELAFTSAIKVIQEKMGSRANYARMEKFSNVNGLTEGEIQFIAQQDSFYMASIGENGFPYIQHRGGSKRFLKVINFNQIGFIDWCIQDLNATNVANWLWYNLIFSFQKT